MSDGPQTPRKPSTARASAGGGRRGIKDKAQASKGESRKKRDQLFIDLVNNETLERQALGQQYAAEMAELRTRYSDDGQRAKDSYIAILERRLLQQRLQTTTRVDSMEEKFSDVMGTLTRLLNETHRIGAVGVTDGLLFSDMSSAPLPPANASMTTANRNSPPPPPASKSPMPQHSHSHQGHGKKMQGLKAVATIASVFSGAPGGVDALPSEDSDRVRKFFVNPLQAEAVKLESLNAKEFCARLEELRDALVVTIGVCVSKLSRANTRIKVLECALDDQSACLASAERLLQNAVVRGDSGTQEAIDACRALGIEVQRKLDEQQAKLLSALDTLIRQSVEVALEKSSFPAQTFGFRRAELVSDFFTEVDRVRLFQDSVFRDIREKIKELSMKKHKTDMLEAAKLFRSNIPESYRKVLHTDDRAFDRSSLLQLLDQVSFEPAAAEIIMAVVQAYIDSLGGVTNNNSNNNVIAITPRASGGLSSDSLPSSFSASSTPRAGLVAAIQGNSGSGRIVVKTTKKDGPLDVPPPSPPPLHSSHDVVVPRNASPTSSTGSPTGGNSQVAAYVRALNSVAYAPMSHPISSPPPSAVALSSGQKRLTSHSGGSTAPTHVVARPPQGGQTSSTSSAPSPLALVPAAEILPPSVTSGIDQGGSYQQQLLHPDLAGVVVPPSLLFVPPLTKGYVSSETKRRMELQRSIERVLYAEHHPNYRATADDDERDGVRHLLPTMSVEEKRSTLLEVVGDCAESVAETRQAVEAHHRPAQHQHHQLNPRRDSDAAGPVVTSPLLLGRTHGDSRGGPPTTATHPPGSNSPSAAPTSSGTKMEVVVANRISARFSSANLKQLLAENTSTGGSGVTPNKGGLEGEQAYHHRPAKLDFRQSSLGGKSAGGGSVRSDGPPSSARGWVRPATDATPQVELPSAARLCSEKQRSLLQQFLEA